MDLRPNRKCLECNHISEWQAYKKWCPKCKTKYKDFIIRGKKTDYDYI